MFICPGRVFADLVFLQNLTRGSITTSRTKAVLTTRDWGGRSSVMREEESKLEGNVNSY